MCESTYSLYTAGTVVNGSYPPLEVESAVEMKYLAHLSAQTICGNLLPLTSTPYFEQGPATWRLLTPQYEKGENKI